MTVAKTARQAPALASLAPPAIPSGTGHHPLPWPFTMAPGDLESAASSAEENIALNGILELGNPETLCCLAFHPSAEVRRRVAENPQTPFDVLDWLCEDEHAGVRAAVASHPKAPQRAMALLVQDSDERVR